jgi:uncharacterized coiled-coil protein SlyX
MNQEQEITQLKKRITQLEQDLERILPLGDEMERRMKILEGSLLPESSHDVPPTQP